VNWARRRLKRGKRALTGPVELIYDRGDKDRGQFHAAMRERFEVNPIQRSTTEAVPLQAADIVAWEHARRFGARGAVSLDRPDRTSVLEMARRFPGADEWVYTRWSGLERLARERGFRRRVDGGDPAAGDDERE
jgi:hypothetical protein